MTTRQQTTNHRTVITRTLPFPRERVFEAWSRSEQFAKWMGPGGYTVTSIAADVREGGAYRFAMSAPDKETMEVRGVYRTIHRPSLLSMTWTWIEDAPEDEVESLLTLEFNDVAAGTELVLTQEMLRSEESAERHNEGWTQAVDELAAFLAQTNA